MTLGGQNRLISVLLYYHSVVIAVIKVIYYVTGAIIGERREYYEVVDKNDYDGH